MKYFKLIVIILLIANLFLVGYKLKKPKPEVIIKTKIEKVYDFTQDPKMIKVYANMFGYVLINKKQYEYEKLAQWMDGFKKGTSKKGGTK